MPTAGSKRSEAGSQSTGGVGTASRSSGAAICLATHRAFSGGGQPPCAGAPCDRTLVEADLAVTSTRPWQERLCAARLHPSASATCSSGTERGRLVEARTLLCSSIILRNAAVDWKVRAGRL